MDMGDVAWLPYDEHGLASGGVRGHAARLLVEQGLPADCNRMLVRDWDRQLAVRELPAGRAVFLGCFEDGINSYWLLPDNGEVYGERPVEDARPLATARDDSSEVLEPVDGPLDFIAASVGHLVESCGSAALAATALAVGPLVPQLGDRVLDLALPR
jgi:hypothetical protein